MFVVTTLLLMANLFFSLFYVISLRKKIILSFGQLAEQQLVSWQSNSVLNLFPLSLSLILVRSETISLRSSNVNI